MVVNPNNSEIELAKEDSERIMQSILNHVKNNPEKIGNGWFSKSSIRTQFEIPRTRSVTVWEILRDKYLFTISLRAIRLPISLLPSSNALERAFSDSVERVHQKSFQDKKKELEELLNE